MNRVPLSPRKPQLQGSFDPERPLDGYYNDLRIVATGYGGPERAAAALHEMTLDRHRANAVSIAQVGLGAWQLARKEPQWLPVVGRASEWLRNESAVDGRFAYFFAPPDTWRLAPPWYSAMAQGEAISLLVRAAATFDDHEYASAAWRALIPLLDPDFGLISETAEGPVLQEYPTQPPAHALNGWIFALWGVHDAWISAGAGSPPDLRTRAADAFQSGIKALARRLARYDLVLGWSRYDLFPHRVTNVASPFYHRLHIEQLRATARLCPEVEAFPLFADRWTTGLRRPPALIMALARKGAFRMLEPRRS